MLKSQLIDDKNEAITKDWAKVCDNLNFVRGKNSIKK